MQTFLPYPDLRESVSCLDPSRLGNQCYRECLTLVRGGWSYHPASKMWVGFEYWLCEYALLGFQELSRRELFYPHHIRAFTELQSTFSKTELPWWLGDDRLHSSHRRALLYKDYSYYSKLGWSDSAATPNAEGKIRYFWPV